MRAPLFAPASTTTTPRLSALTIRFRRGKFPAAAVIRIMTTVGAEEMAVCLSDLLEGMLIEDIGGEKDG